MSYQALHRWQEAQLLLSNAERSLHAVYHSLEVFQSWFMHLSQSWTTWTITLLPRNNSRKETLLNATKRLRHTNHFTLSFRLHPCHHTFGAKCKSPHSTEKHGRQDVSFHKHSIPKRVYVSSQYLLKTFTTPGPQPEKLNYDCGNVPGLILSFKNFYTCMMTTNNRNGKQK